MVWPGTIRRAPGGYVRLRRRWRPGDRVVLELDMAARVVYAHPRMSPVRRAARPGGAAMAGR